MTNFAPVNNAKAMTDKEIKAEMELLTAAGLNPLLCDTPVPLVDVPVLAGNPAEAGDASGGEYVLLPHALVGRHPVFLIDVEGLSMRDHDIMPGDRLEVEFNDAATDGSIVVAEVDGEFTVKTFFTDDEGTRWLIPHNSDFMPIMLTGRKWRIVGKVIGIRKGMPHTSYSDCAKAVMNQRRLAVKDAVMDSSMPLPDMPRNQVFKQFYRRLPIDFLALRHQVERVVVKQMRHAYEWYAAYRILSDLGLLDDNMLTRFATQMNNWFPEAPIACSADRLGEYAVGHTARAFTLWNSEKFRTEMRRGQSVVAFNILYLRCEELRAALFPVPVMEPSLP